MTRWLSRIWRNLVNRDRVEADLDAELQAWVNDATQQKISAGISPAEARRAALLEAGGVEQIKESVRDVQAGNFLYTILRDLQFATRLLRKEIGFTAVVILMLALGIGANTAVFSVVNAVLLHNLPYSQPERVVALYEKRPREHMLRGMVSPPDFLDWREQNTAFESMGALARAAATWQSENGAEQIAVGTVSPGFLDVVGVRPAIGTGFQKETDPNFRYSVLLSHGFWQRRFGADPNILSRPLTLNGNQFEVAGVLPANLEFPLLHDVDIFAPLVFRNRDNPDRAGHSFNVIARLKSGYSLHAAQTELDTISTRLEQQYPAVNKGHGANVISIRELLLGPLELPLLALQAAVAFVLLIACGNFSNLLLARTLARERELSIRLAIGAGRARLLQQLLSESTLLAILGGAAGIAVAYAGVPLFCSLIPPDMHMPGIQNAHVDATVLGVCLLLSVLCGVAFGLAPAWRGAGVGISTALKDTAVDGGRRRERFRKFLIAAQIGLSVVLLTGAAIFFRSFNALRSVDPGFRAPGVLTVQIFLPGRRYPDPQSVVRFTNEWTESIRRLPRVQSVGLTSHLPVSGADSRRGLAIEGVAPPDPNQPRRAHVRTVTPDYFQAMGMRIVQGRPFLDTDRAGSHPVMIVNEAAARMYFPQGKAVGHRGHLGGIEGPWSEVVGVVANVRHWGLDVEPKPEQYYCHLQEPTYMVALAIRSDGDPRLLTSSVRQELRRLDSLLPIARMDTMEELVSRSIASQRSLFILFGLFAVLALLLTAAGIWGTMAYLISQRRREIAIRLALGATNKDVVRSAVYSAMKLVAAGLIVGIAISVLLIRLTAVTFFGVSATDPITYVAISVLLVAIACAANYFPARRLTRFVRMRELSV